VKNPWAKLLIKHHDVDTKGGFDQGKSASLSGRSFPAIHVIGDWVGPRPCLNLIEKWKICSTVRKQMQITRSARQ
jgi:hypothetical protein